MSSSPVIGGMRSTPPILDVRDLEVAFQVEGGIVRAVDGVSFSVRQGEVVAVVGESGSGKSVTAMTLMGLTRSPNASFRGTAMLESLELVGATTEQLRKVRGGRIAMIFQDPMTSLNPVYRVGHQIAEQIMVHDRAFSKKRALTQAVELMERVGISGARQRSRCYPHELSGGMRQRVMIAMALSCSPKLLIADEPTTALDVTIQAQILDEIRTLRSETGASVILVTHDMGVVADVADRVIVMYAGRVVEQGTLEQIFYNPQHPYTWGLLRSIARLDGDRARRLQAIPGLPPSLMNAPEGCHFRPRCPYADARCIRVPALESRVPGSPDHLDRCWLDQNDKARFQSGDGEITSRSKRCLPVFDGLGGVVGTTEETRNLPPLMEVEHLCVEFPVRGGLISNRGSGRVHAVSDVTFSLATGETLGIVGESGCGKTTLIRALIRLIDPTDGSIRFRGRDITHARTSELRPVRRQMQMVFQDPYASLNPRKRIGAILGPILRMREVPKSRVGSITRELLTQVGLDPEHVNRYPHEFSGGQRQRIGIARALASEPKVILLDEPVSALDVSIQAQVINLLEDLQAEHDLSYILVAHDLSVVRHVADRIAVMYLGKIVEIAEVERLFAKPIHPYTLSLLDAVPIPDPRQNDLRERHVVEGEPPSPTAPPSGCRFHPRCHFADDVCRRVEPPLMHFGGSHLAACHHPQNVDAGEISVATRSNASPLTAGELEN
jgi:peptide/nickel transport system ATP-binding protein